jgi:hypothetical protein
MLFSKDKDLVLRITNMVLVLWFVLANVLVASNIITIAIPERANTKEEYHILNCKEVDDEVCDTQYALYTASYKKRFSYVNRELLITISMAAIIGGTIFALNSKKGEK